MKKKGFLKIKSLQWQLFQELGVMALFETIIINFKETVKEFP